jgi:hypothetical protein
MEPRFQDVSCPRCHQMAQSYTVPLALIPQTAEEAWQALCEACFRLVLEREPWAELHMRPIQSRRGRR